MGRIMLLNDENGFFMSCIFGCGFRLGSFSELPFLLIFFEGHMVLFNGIVIDKFVSFFLICFHQYVYKAVKLGGTDIQ